MTGPPSAADDDLRLRLLVLRCQAGDGQAFAQLFERFGPRTLAHLQGLIGPDADDAQQDVWLTVYRRLSTLSDPGAFRTWLYRTTRHRAIDFLRKRRREQELMDETAPAADDVELLDHISIGDLDGDLLGKTISALPTLQREVMLLRYRDAMSYAEIALVVGCPVGTVRTRLHHAKRRLQESLKRGQP